MVPQLKIEYLEVFKCFQNSIEMPSCRYAVADQYGNPVCLRNFDAPGLCNGLEKCPYNIRKAI
jgi:hypothetical protein